jgi:dihydropteroate synthase
LELLRATESLSSLGYPLLISASNKTFLGAVLDLDIDHRRDASLAAAAMGIGLGGRVLRVHDVEGTRRVRDAMAAVIDPALARL